MHRLLSARMSSRPAAATAVLLALGLLILAGGLLAGVRFAEFLAAPSAADESPALIGSSFADDAQSGAEEELRQKLVEFFRVHNPARVGNVEEIVRRYKSIEQINKGLRAKYHADLDTPLAKAPPVAKSASKAKSVAQTMPVADAAEHLDNAIALSDSAAEDEQGLEDDAASAFALDGDGAAAPQLAEASKQAVVICVGVKLTGCEQFTAFARSGLGLESASEAEDAARMQTLSVVVAPDFDRFEEPVLAGASALQYVEELALALHPGAKVVVAVRAFESWWPEAKQGDWRAWLGGFASLSATATCLDARFAYEAAFAKALRVLPVARRLLFNVRDGDARATLRRLARWLGRDVAAAGGAVAAVASDSASGRALNALHWPLLPPPSSGSGSSAPLSLLVVGLHAVADVVRALGALGFARVGVFARIAPSTPCRDAACRASKLVDAAGCDGADAAAMLQGLDVFGGALHSLVPFVVNALPRARVVLVTGRFCAGKRHADKRAEQDLVDHVAAIVPSGRLTVVDVTALDLADRLCRLVAAKGAACDRSVVPHLACV